MAEGTAAVSTAEAAPPSTDITINLEKPIMANGEMVTKLTFKEPTGADMMMLGDKWPLNIDGTPNAPAAGRAMSMLAGVPPSTIRAMSAKDFSTCAFVVLRFFMPGPQANLF